jgi:hypothetical protein
MAIQTITKTKLKLNGDTAMPETVTLTADGGRIAYDEEDTKIVLLIGGAAATIEAGNALQGDKQLAIPFETGKTKAVVIESGKFVHVDGSDRGYIRINGTGATVAAIVLP